MVQQNLGYPALQKIDPNTQLMLANKQPPDEDKSNDGINRMNKIKWKAVSKN